MYGTAVRDYIYIDDFSRCVAELLSLDVKNEIFNIGSGVGHSVNQVICTVEAVTGIPVVREYREARKDDVHEIVLDVGKLKSIVPYSPADLETGIRKFYLFARSQAGETGLK